MTEATQRGPSIYLDVSRLLTAGRRSTPSGIERVELAYAKRFHNTGRARFVGFFLGRLHFLPYHFVSIYIETLENGWTRADRSSRIKTLARMAMIYLILLLLSLWALFGRTRRSTVNCIYVNVSHENLTARDAIERFKLRTGAKMLFLVHDLIPITHPEYVRPNQARLHRRRMDTVAALADAVLVNSVATKDELSRYFRGGGRLPEIHTVHLGIAPRFAACGAAEVGSAAAYFLIVATIEPRKNHLLLLNLWRSLAVEPASTPRLIVVGRRGWENDMVVDMLERCEAFGNLVEERRDMGDSELAILMQGARALLLPSFAEGYGLPVAEALGAGTPVICSDLPALREIGGDVPEYINPLDGPAWRRAVLDYAAASSPRRDLQCQRMRSWSAPRWDRHFEEVSIILDELASTAHRVD